MWIQFKIYAFIAIIVWISGVVFVYLSNDRKAINILGIMTIACGILLLGIFTAKLWIEIERPPLRTLGETRLWYSLFLPSIGLTAYLRWKYKWLAAYSIGLAIVFLGINYANPDTYEKTLMPALQSPWFVPHVIVYIFSYAILAASSLVAVKGLYQIYFKKLEDEILDLTDNLVYLGFAFLTLGLLFGALWAKEAWGHYWTWDPKETWAFLTWLMYLLYIHNRSHQKHKHKFHLWMLSIAFMILLICWFGINYLPTAANSVHTYTG